MDQNPYEAPKGPFDRIRDLSFAELFINGVTYLVAIGAGLFLLAILFDLILSAMLRGSP